MSTQIFGPQNEYELFEKKVIGKGAYGVVYECQKIVPDNQKAQSILLCVKITNCQGLGETEKKYQERENQINKIISNSSDNKNILKIYYQNYDQLNSKLMLVMERCQTNLKELLITKKKFSQNEIMDFIKQFANGYEVLYKEKVVHRDIKPENILVNEENGQYCYKLSDYGVGKINQKLDLLMTKTGTPCYSAPEINVLVNDPQLMEWFNSMKEQKSVVDMFSLGMVIYQLATGNSPFKTLSQKGVKNFFSEIKLVPFKVMIEGLNNQLLELVEKMLLYNPQKRLSFEAFKEQLKQTQETNEQQYRFNTFTTNKSFNNNNNIILNFNPSNQQRLQTFIKFQPSNNYNQTQNNCGSQNQNQSNSSNLNQSVTSNNSAQNINFKSSNNYFPNQGNNIFNSTINSQKFIQQKNNNNIPSQINQNFAQQNFKLNQVTNNNFPFHSRSSSFATSQQFPNVGTNFQNKLPQQVQPQQFQQNGSLVNQKIVQNDQLTQEAWQTKDQKIIAQKGFKNL